MNKSLPSCSEISYQTGAGHHAVDQADKRDVGSLPAWEQNMHAACKNLAFPLNVYAYALILEEGQADALHYGLFQREDMSIRQAQQHSTDLILSRLPASPSRILEIGVGLGTTFSLLTQQGHQVHGITPDSAQIACLQARFGQQVAVSCQRLEDFEAAAESFDWLLFQESAQYIDPLVIFNQALGLLPYGGNILIVDEFALRRTEARQEGLHLLADILTLADRMGFELVENIDLSSMAAPTLDHLLRMTHAHRQRLQRDLGLEAGVLAQLDESNRRYRQKYAEGIFGYALLHFRKKTMPKWRVDLLGEQRATEMLSLFERVFGHSMSPQLWRWKYDRANSQALGIWRDGRLVAHYGGMPRAILLFGEARTAVQIGDVMVDPAERGVLTRKGPFFLMAATFQERYIGYGKVFLTAYGFPNERAMRVAERLGLYTGVGSVIEIEWKPAGKMPHCLTQLQPIDGRHEIWQTSAIDALWHRMAMDLQDAIVGVRDQSYLRARYLDHPEHAYQLVLVVSRFGTGLRGLMVLRHDPHETEIMDLIAPLHAMPLMVSHARRIAGIHGKNRLFLRIPKNFAARFTATGGVQTGEEIPIPTPAWSHAPAAEMLHNHWWLTGGDMDFR